MTDWFLYLTQREECLPVLAINLQLTPDWPSSKHLTLLCHWQHPSPNLYPMSFSLSSPASDSTIPKSMITTSGREYLATNLTLTPAFILSFSCHPTPLVLMESFVMTPFVYFLWMSFPFWVWAIPFCHSTTYVKLDDLNSTSTLIYV